MTKILVVDDEKDIQPLFQQRFRREIKFVFAYFGEAALNCVEEYKHVTRLITKQIGEL